MRNLLDTSLEFLFTIAILKKTKFNKQMFVKLTRKTKVTNKILT